ncbi:metal ABC transporter permease [Aeromicrobium phragmitis]|uniref:Metal ABC transporter permease n=1 Tax=Aeromicrobium phragmitis TaxID=2478914 RepID=A0A3L8PLM3_9ACTN|nr:zinc ABC transporter permease AztB [Aeromicrobium phragmitis]RLV56235.1 metal ABC transporter permease [Aeromicrobium phragmitis]
MDVLTEPFAVSFVSRAAVAGILVAIGCACAGTWVVLRGMAFLGDAMSHGMLPGVATASLLGASLHLGAAVAAGAMAAGVSALQRSRRLGNDTTIGLLFVGMLALGVIIVSASSSFAVDLTAFLFGDVLGVRSSEVLVLAATTAVIVLVTVVGRRAFLLAALDHRIAHTTGLRPRLTEGVLLALLTLAIVSSFSVVGTLLVFGMLIAPPAAALLWTSRVSSAMVLAAVFGCIAVLGGLVISWHAATAAGATITLTAVGIFALSLGLSSLKRRATSPLPTERTLVS